MFESLIMSLNWNWNIFYFWKRVWHYWLFRKI